MTHRPPTRSVQMDWRQYTSTLGLALRMGREVVELSEAAHAGDADVTIASALELRAMIDALLSDFGAAVGDAARDASIAARQRYLDRWGTGPTDAIAAEPSRPGMTWDMTERKNEGDFMIVRDGEPLVFVRARLAVTDGWARAGALADRIRAFLTASTSEEQP